MWKLVSGGGHIGIGLVAVGCVCEVCARTVPICSLWFAMRTEQVLFSFEPSPACESQKLSAHLDPGLAHPRQRSGKPLSGLLFPVYWHVLLYALKRLWVAFNPFLLGSYLYLVADFLF